MTCLPVDLGPEGLMRFLPHRPPFLMVDRVTGFGTPPPTLTACRFLSGNEPFFAGHFPGLGVLPGALALEGLAQCCAVLEAFLDVELPPEALVAALRNLEAGFTLMPGFDPVKARELQEARRKRTIGLVGAANVKFLHPVFAGCRLDYEVELDRALGEARHFRLSARVGEKEVIRGTLSASSVPMVEVQ